MNVPAVFPPVIRSIMQAAEAGQIMELGADRIKVRLESAGQYIIGKLVGIRQGKQDDFRIYDLDLPGGIPCFLLGTTDLDRKINGDYVGQYLIIVREHDLDVGQPSPMAVYRVFVSDTLPAGVTPDNCSNAVFYRGQRVIDIHTALLFDD